MATYYHRHPRGFANECDIVRCDDVSHIFDLEREGYEYITRRDLSKHIDDVNARNNSWGASRSYGQIVKKDVWGDYGYSSTLWLQLRESGSGGTT